MLLSTCLDPGFLDSAEDKNPGGPEYRDTILNYVLARYCVDLFTIDCIMSCPTSGPIKL